jgi:hypothetical protein
MSRQGVVWTKKIVAVLVIVAITGTIGLTVLGSQSKPPMDSASSATTSTSESAVSSSVVVYEVLASNLTLHGPAARVPCAVLTFSFDCPLASNASLSQVELVKDGSAYFYLLHNQTAPTGYGSGANQAIHRYDVWFTNSTVFCITPAYSQNPICPTLPDAQTEMPMPFLSASSLNPDNGLRLNLNLSTNSIGLLNVSVAEVNTLGQTNNVMRVDNWPFRSPYFWFRWAPGCGPDLPVGYAILQGSYGDNNYTEGTSVALMVQSPIQCPVSLDGSTNFSFKPHDDIMRSGAWSGFWTGVFEVYSGTGCPYVNPSPRHYCPLTFVSFAPGPYT